MREVIAFDLERRGYLVLHAESGLAAIAVVKAQNPDLVISDVRMPSGSGIDLLRWIKEWNPAGPSFIYMTAFADISSDEALHQGAEAFLTKPLENESLLEETARALVHRSDRWRTAVEAPSASSIVLPDDPLLVEGAGARVHYGSGGVFVEVTVGFPDSLEIVSFNLPCAFGGVASRLKGQARVRWVRHESTPELACGLGLEFLYIEDPGRAAYLAFLEQQAPKAYVPLGFV
jgi:CheY-like chemotaxis protein